MKNHYRLGFTLIETLIAAAIFTMILTTFVASLSSLGFVQIKAKLRTQAVHLSREALEVAYNISTQNWTEFQKLNGTYYLSIRSSPDNSKPFPYIELNSLPQTIDNKYSRKIIIEPAHRDSKGQVVDPPGTGQLDPSTKKVTVITSWNAFGNTQQITNVSYLVNMQTY